MIRISFFFIRYRCTVTEAKVELYGCNSVAKVPLAQVSKNFPALEKKFSTLGKINFLPDFLVSDYLAEK